MVRLYMMRAADKHLQLCCIGTHRQPLVGTGFADDTKTLAEAIA